MNVIPVICTHCFPCAKQCWKSCLTTPQWGRYNFSLICKWTWPPITYLARNRASVGMAVTCSGLLGHQWHNAGASRSTPQKSTSNSGFIKPVAFVICQSFHVNDLLILFIWKIHRIIIVSAFFLIEQPFRFCSGNYVLCSNQIWHLLRNPESPGICIPLGLISPISRWLCETGFLYWDGWTVQLLSCLQRQVL